MQAKLQFLLKVLATHGDEPMEEVALKDAVALRFRCPLADVAAVILAAEQHSLILGTRDFVLGTVWGLTQLGRNKAAELMR